MKILIKFPTRGRSDKFFNVLDIYYQLSDNNDNITFQITIDTDDETMNNNIVLSKLNSYKNLNYTLGVSKNKIDAVNRDIIIGDWDIILLASDDMIPKVKGYDDIIRNKMTELYPDTDGVLWFNDGNQGDKLNTLCILGKKYYERFNYIYHPDYTSLWADNEFMDVANLLNKQTYFNDVIIRHEHPDVGLGQRDFVHFDNIKFDYIDKEIYLKRKSNNFNIK
jgi:hypothetical protein